MTMMFEVEDLAVASPATVSRCGMIYMEPAALGIRPLCVAWLKTLPPSFASFAPAVLELFDIYVPEAVTFVRKSLTETVATVSLQIPKSQDIKEK
jgi:dynein heavy chain